MSTKVEIGTTDGALCGTVICGTTLCGAASDMYELPQTLAFLGAKARTRYRSDDRLLADGAAVDGFAIAARDVVVSGMLLSATATAQEALLAEIANEAATQNQRFRVGVNRYINISRLKALDAEAQPMTGRTLHDVQITWEASDPYWYDPVPTNSQALMTGDGTMTVTVASDIHREIHPVILLESEVGYSVPSVRLTNQSDSNRWCLYEDTNLREGASAVIDCRDGTVTRGGTNSVRFFSGTFLRLLPGANVIAYEGARALITIQWIPRWL